MRGTMLVHKFQHVGGKTGRTVPPVAALRIVERIQHAPGLLRHDAVSVEEILLQRQPRELPMHITITIIGDTMPQYQILGASRRTDRPARSPWCRSPGRASSARETTQRSSCDEDAPGSAASECPEGIVTPAC